MSQATIAANISGVIAAGAHTFAITDPMQFKTLKVDGLQPTDSLNLKRRNRAGTGWETVTDKGREVQLNHLNRTATPAEVGTYTVAGSTAGNITLWTEEMD